MQTKPRWYLLEVIMVWERNDLHSWGTKILKVYGQAHQRKSQLDIILTITKKSHCKPSNITAQTRVKKEKTAEW